MKGTIQLISTVAVFFVLAAPAFAHTSYIGYSGAPGRQACSISCHHRHGFIPSVTVTGFPDSYVPGQQYTIAVAHQSGTTIKQFNASIRVGTGSANAAPLPPALAPQRTIPPGKPTAFISPLLTRIQVISSRPLPHQEPAQCDFIGLDFRAISPVAPIVKSF